MKTMLSSPRLHLWCVLVILPLHAIVVAYANSIHWAAWTSILLEQPAQATAFTATSSKLQYLGYGMFAIEIVLLLTAVARLPKLRSALVMKD